MEEGRIQISQEAGGEAEEIKGKKEGKLEQR